MWQIQDRLVEISGSGAGTDNAGRIVAPLEGQTGTAVWVFWELRDRSALETHTERERLTPGLAPPLAPPPPPSDPCTAGHRTGIIHENFNRTSREH
ncbi:hypothetical protein Q8A67_008726 [Cirrhinus molitorella]|uniref:Uncharacterized protein n=1 Tax=Cirrhinus molitorella TaxID=172907 RepID=A0AA88PXP2_9TELE|nr:hypothetical protein Q8A67_008726 [Cirrhinus molitorella]